MKRYGDLYNKIHDIDNIKLAHVNASKGKQGYSEVKMVNSDPEYYCRLIKEMLVSKRYSVSEYRVKEKMDKGKLRVLYVLPYFPDRIIQHAMMQILEPIWKKVLINDTYQSIKGRGIKKAKDRVSYHVQKYKPEHSLKTDVKKFYPSITNPVLKMIVRKKIKCKGTLWLLDEIITSLPELPIGNYISQYLGNLTLAYIDHKIKEKYRVKMYYRYCDDIIILGDKQMLHKVLKVLKEELKLLDLTLKGNYQISKVQDRGIDFVGFVFRHDTIRLRKSIAKELVKAKDDKSISSYFGWAKEARAIGLWNKHIKTSKEFTWK